MKPGGTSLASSGSMVLLQEQKEYFRRWQFAKALELNLAENQSQENQSQENMVHPVEVSPSGFGAEPRRGGTLTMDATPQTTLVDKASKVQEAVQEAVWGAEDGYISEGGGSDYGCYIPNEMKCTSLVRKKMARRDSAMEGNASAMEGASLLSQPPPPRPHEGPLTDVAEGDNAAEGFTFRPSLPQNVVWDGGDAFFSDNSEAGTQCSSESVAGMEDQLQMLDLEDEMDISEEEEEEEAPTPPEKEETRAPVVNYDDTPIMNEWDGGDGYFSGSDYGDYVEE